MTTRARRRGGLLLATIGILLTWPVVFRSTETLQLDDATRAAMEGEDFVELSDGWVHYKLNGPMDGQPVVLVHGFSSPMFIWEKQAQALGAEGFRVLRYDLYGRGYSDRPKGPYDADLFDRQLVQLLDRLGIREPVDIVGLSMGGPITLRFVDRHPERVRKFGLVAPAGYGANIPAVAHLLRIPILSDYLMLVLGDRIVLEAASRSATKPEAQERMRAEYLDQLQYAGYKRALLSTLLHHDMLNLGELYERVGRLGKPAILFWGDADAIVPFEFHEHVQAAIPNIELHVIPGGGHTPNFETPEYVTPALLEFLER